MQCLFYTMFLHLFTPDCFCPRIFFLKHRLDLLQWIPFISVLHSKLMLLSSGISGLVTDFLLVFGAFIMVQVIGVYKFKLFCKCGLVKRKFLPISLARIL